MRFMTKLEALGERRPPWLPQIITPILQPVWSDPTAIMMFFLVYSSTKT